MSAASVRWHSIGVASRIRRTGAISMRSHVDMITNWQLVIFRGSYGRQEIWLRRRPKWQKVIDMHVRCACTCSVHGERRSHVPNVSKNGFKLCFFVHRIRLAVRALFVHSNGFHMSNRTKQYWFRSTEKDRAKNEGKMFRMHSERRKPTRRQAREN